MIKKPDKNKVRLNRHARVRKKIIGTAERPRLCVFRSNKNIYAQVIDDTEGKTLVAASTLDADLKGNFAHGGDKQAAKAANRLRKKRLPPVSTMLFLTEAVIFIPVVFKNWRMRLEKPALNSNRKRSTS